MNSQMVHRGRDDAGVYLDPDCAFAMGARGQSTIDFDGDHQPTPNEDNSLWAVLSGEIYNSGALTEQLRRAGHKFRCATGSDVLVHLYEDYGSELVHALDGMYAFAIWDARRRRLLLGRDRFGEKPLFYCEQPDRLAFASELTALRAALDFTPDLDPASLDAYLVLGYVPGARTIYQDIRALAPGSILEWSADAPTPRVSRYWSMPARPPVQSRAMTDYAEEATVLLSRAVSSRRSSDAPVGVLLSGDVETSLVARIVADTSGFRLRTFTVTYDVGAVSQAAEARSMAMRLGSEHHEHTLSSGEVKTIIPVVLSALDQPNADPALIALHAAAGLARKSVNVVLGGEGADELFGGYPRYRWLARAERIDAILPDALGRRAAQIAKRVEHPVATRVAKLLSPADVVERQIDWVETGLRSLRRGLYGERLREAICHDLAVRDAESVVAEAGTVGPIGRLMHLDQSRHLPDGVLAQAERATMQLSMEMRSPFLSRELAEFSASIPGELHASDGGKAVLRAVARSMPGMGEQAHAKPAFRAPLKEWLRGPLASLVDQLPADGRLVREGWLDGAEMRRLIAAHLAGDADHGSAIWAVLTAELCL